ncbi:MAG TPA: phosphoribosylformylglycinamidine synthase I [Planctomycetota bacterium]|nr:phosphoribosylformylglycinamidine synthase I [Planctomycetota bacterium]
MKTAPQAIVVRTAGTNCDRETCIALERAGAKPELLHLRKLIAEPARLESASIVVFPGGFSYGDDVAAGRIQGFEVRQHLAGHLGEFVASGGFVLGVCNGFQVLVDTGLLENLPSAAGRGMALAPNVSGHFECRWVHLKNEDSRCTWLPAGRVWPAPIAHGEGRLALRDGAMLEQLASERRIVLRYVKPDGSRSDDLETCPNGSQDQIAGVCDMTGRVLGLMPHPERNVTPWHHPQWTRLTGMRSEGEGLDFYRRMVVAASQSAATRSARVPTIS